MIKRKNVNRPANPNKLARKMFNDMLNARRELKYIEISSESAMPVDGGIIALTQKIVQGDSAGTRDGSDINIAGLSVRFQLALNAAASLDFCRLILFSDNDSHGAYPTPTGALDGILTVADPNAAYDFPVAVRHRFKILLDQDFAMSNAGNSKVVQFNRNIKMGAHKVYYSATTDVESANNKGAIYAMVISDTPTTTTAYNLTVAVKYYDS